MAKWVLLIFAASQPLADALIQNPEMAALLTDPASLEAEPSRESIEEEGRRLLEVASGYTHSLDRLRFLKQRWLLPIAVCDLAGIWEQEKVWRALSDLADALIELAMETAAAEYAAQKGLAAKPKLGVAAFGKLGGRELNYSSDVDLVFICEDGLEEEGERHAMRIAERAGRALSDRMGRGSLYRVDLRLRPFGSAGPIAPTMRSIEAYYRSHSQVWESQALVRSRVIVGPPGLSERWEALRNEHCFRPSWSSAALEEIVEMRFRMEGQAHAADLKRGAGGIRDVEFAVQMLQLVHGRDVVGARDPATLPTLRALAEFGIVGHSFADTLCEGYEFLRKLEHRAQMAADAQTHTLPKLPEAMDRLAVLTGLKSGAALSRRLDSQTRAIRQACEDLLRSTIGIAFRAVVDPRKAALAELGDSPEAASWFDGMPDGASFYRSLVENRDSLRRVRRVLDAGPAIVSHFRRHISLTEALLSGEIEEELDPGAALADLAPDTPVERVAATVRIAWTRIAARRLLSLEAGEAATLASTETDHLGSDLRELFDATIRHAAARLYCDFDVLALGSFATSELGLSSDLDMLWLIGDSDRQPEAETQGEHMLLFLDSLKRHGAPLAVDLRLRPEGKKGLLVRTYAGLESYGMAGMEMWERFALGEARLVYGDPEAERSALAVSKALPLTPNRFEEMLRMKKRIETERVPLRYRNRQVKLGRGGLADIEWLVRLHEMRYPTAIELESDRRIPSRISAIARTGLINSLERDSLLSSHSALTCVRFLLVLLGFTTDVVPENPDKLDRLARAAGFEDGNAFLGALDAVRHGVRSLYDEGIERLRS